MSDWLRVWVIYNKTGEIRMGKLISCFQLKKILKIQGKSLAAVQCAIQKNQHGLTSKIWKINFYRLNIKIEKVDYS